MQTPAISIPGHAPGLDWIRAALREVDRMARAALLQLARGEMTCAEAATELGALQRFRRMIEPIERRLVRAEREQEQPRYARLELHPNGPEPAEPEGRKHRNFINRSALSRAARLRRIER